MFWSGFGVEPIPGDWTLLQDHIFHKDPADEEPMMGANWMALGVQRPGEPIGSAPVLHGPPGTGKGWLAHSYGKLLARTMRLVTDKSHVSGRFNNTCLAGGSYSSMKGYSVATGRKPGSSKRG